MAARSGKPPAMTVAALNQSDRGKEALQASGDWLLITTGWGVGVALAVWVAGGVSGAHLNLLVAVRAADRPDHRHRSAGPGHLRRDRRVQHAREGLAPLVVGLIVVSFGANACMTTRSATC